MDGITGIANVIILGLAASQVVEVVRHSKLSLPLRIWAADVAPLGGFRGFIAQVISCPFCFSHWVSSGFTLLLLVSLWGYWPAQAMAIVFAATRVANLSNDIFHERIRTFKNDIIEEEDLEVEEGEPDKAFE